MTKITEIIWDNWNLEHIKKHNVSKKEIEEAIINLITHKYVYKRRILLIGRSGTRMLSIIINEEKKGKYYIITARDAAKKERIKAYEKENK